MKYGVPTILTDDDKSEIARLYSTRRISLNKLARKFHVRNTRIREVLVAAGVEVRTLAHADNLRRWNASDEGKAHIRKVSKKNQFKPGCTVTDAQRAASRQNMITYNTSDEHKAVSRKMGKEYGKANMRKWAKSPEGREHARKEGLKTAELFDERQAPFIRAGLLARTSKQQRALYELLRFLLGNDVILEYHPPKTRYFIDIAILSKRLAIEVDDKNHVKYPMQRVSDTYRQTELEGLGWQFLRFANEQIDDGCQDCLQEVLSFIGTRVHIDVRSTKSAHPRPSDAG